MGKILRGPCFVLYKILPIDEVFHDTFFTGFPHDTQHHAGVHMEEGLCVLL